MRQSWPPSSRRRVGIEGLESRILFHLELIGDIANNTVAPGTASSEINLAPHFDNELINGSIVRLDTDLGNVDIQLFDGGAPQSVANFLGYVSRGDYNNTYFHRSIPGFVVQGGGFNASTIDNPAHIPTQPPVVNEFSPQRSNVRGTLAMAKVGGNPDSATSEFFFNLENNSSNLDNQNGGFTVFGQVINNSLSVVDAIAGLQTFNPPAVPHSDLPLQGTPPATVDNVVKIRSATLIPEAGLFNYTVQSSDPGLVTPVVENGVLRLLYGSGQIGTARITITASDAEGTTATDTFIAGVGELIVEIGDGASRSATFTDADGTAATISLKGGSGVLSIGGSNLSQNVGRRGATILGTIGDLAIDLTGTSTRGALSVRAKGGDGVITVKRFTSDGSMRSIAGKQVNLAGNLTIAGNVARADFADVANSTLTFGGAGGSLALSLRTADAVDIVSQIPIKSLKADSFTGSGPDVGTITAPAIGKLTVRGDFGQRLDIAGPLGNAKVGGVVNSFLPWSIAGGAGKLSLGAVADGFVADFFGAISSVSVTGDLAGDISAPSIRSLSVRGAINGANLILTAGGTSLGRASVKGAIANSRIQAADGIGTVTAGSINASTIYAGVNTDGGILPVNLDDFGAAPSSIRSVSVRDRGTPAFVNSNIAARSLGRLNLGLIQVGNGGVPFGISSDSIASVSATGEGPLKFRRLDDASQSSAQQDFELRVF